VVVGLRASNLERSGVIVREVGRCCGFKAPIIGTDGVVGPGKVSIHDFNELEITYLVSTMQIWLDYWKQSANGMLRLQMMHPILHPKDSKTR